MLILGHMKPVKCMNNLNETFDDCMVDDKLVRTGIAAIVGHGFTEGMAERGAA